MKIWLIRGDCPDYYCGCGGGHVLAAASTECEALRLQAETQKLGKFDSIVIDDPIELDSIVTDQFT